MHHAVIASQKVQSIFPTSQSLGSSGKTEAYQELERSWKLCLADDAEQHIPPLDVLSSVLCKGFSEEMISDRGRDFQSIISDEQKLLFLTRQKSEVTASFSISDKESGLEVDLDVSRNFCDMRSDLGSDFDIARKF